MTGDIKVFSGGVLLLGVHNLKDENGDKKPSMYCCTSAEYTLGINELPALNLVLGQGSPISGSKDTMQHSDGSLSLLLRQSFSRRSNSAADAKFLRCTLYEASVDGTTKHAVFRGYIVNVTELIKTGDITVKALRVLCLGVGAILQIAPIAGFRRTSGALIVNGASGPMEMPSNSSKVEFKDPFMLKEGTSIDQIINDWAVDLDDRDILTKMALIANLIAVYSQHEDGDDAPIVENLTDKILHIKDILYCDYTLDKTLFDSEDTEHSLHATLAIRLLDGLASNTVLASITSAATSMDILMNVIPHFKYGGTASDFRMELMPSEAWNPEIILNIPKRVVTGCNTSLNHMEHLNDPEVLIVDYSEGPGSEDGSGTSGEASGCYGVYAVNEEIRAWARKRYAGVRDDATNNALEGMIGETYYKAQFERAPSWMRWDYMNDLVDTSIFKIKEDEPANDDEAKGGDDTRKDADLERKALIADVIAQAMYVYFHGASDTATFNLSPDVRFGLNEDIGCLEDHLGKTVDICGYRGILKQIRYTYSSGSVTSNSYSIVLERLRLATKDEKHVICPIYVKRKIQHKTSSNFDSLWSDSWNNTPKKNKKENTTLAQKIKDRIKQAETEKNVAQALKDFFGDE